MRTNVKRPFESAQIEIVETTNHDILTVSGFFGEEEEFELVEKLYWE